MQKQNKTIGNAILALVILAGILMTIPAGYAQETARDFSYPLIGDWGHFTSHVLGFGQFNPHEENGEQTFSGRHLAQDTNMGVTVTGTKVYTIANGIVVISDTTMWGKYGNYDSSIGDQGKGYAIVIDHQLPDETHVTSLYGHIQPGSDNYNEASETGTIPIGSTVRKGQYIARVADYLMKDGSNWHHLHFGIRKGPYTAGHDWDYIKGYDKTGWNSDNTTHEIWYNPTEFIQNHLVAAIPPTLYRYSDPASIYNDRVYEIKNDAGGNTYAHWIIDPKVFSDLGYNANTIYNDKDGYNLNHYITGENMVFRDGTLIKRNDGRIYEVRSGEKRWFPAWESFSNRGYTLAMTYSVPDQKANLLPAGMTIDYRLVKTASNGDIYLVQVNEATQIKEKKHIMDPDAMTIWGFDWSKIETISDAEMNSYPYAGELGHVRYGAFIGKSSDRSATYFLSADENGNIVKRKIATDAIKNYLTNGIPRTTYWLSDSEFNSVLEGEEYKKIPTSYAVIIPTDPSDCASCHIEPMATPTPTPTPTQPPGSPPEPTPTPDPTTPAPVPTPTPSPLEKFDLNSNHAINTADLVIIASHFEEATAAPYPAYDINQDGEVNILDLVMTGQHFGLTY